MNLPESVLLCLFPNGLVLSRQSVALSDGGDGEEEEEVYGVDVSAEFEFRSMFSSAANAGPSSIQNAFNTSSLSFAHPQKRSTELLPLLVS